MQQVNRYLRELLCDNNQRLHSLVHLPHEIEQNWTVILMWKRQEHKQKTTFDAAHVSAQVICEYMQHSARPLYCFYCPEGDKSSMKELISRYMSTRWQIRICGCGTKAARPTTTLHRLYPVWHCGDIPITVGIDPSRNDTLNIHLVVWNTDHASTTKDIPQIREKASPQKEKTRKVTFHTCQGEIKWVFVSSHTTSITCHVVTIIATCMPVVLTDFSDVNKGKGCLSLKGCLRSATGQRQQAGSLTTKKTDHQLSASTQWSPCHQPNFLVRNRKKSRNSQHSCFFAAFSFSEGKTPTPFNLCAVCSQETVENKYSSQFQKCLRLYHIPSALAAEPGDNFNRTLPRLPLCTYKHQTNPQIKTFGQKFIIDSVTK